MNVFLLTPEMTLVTSQIYITSQSFPFQAFIITIDQIGDLASARHVKHASLSLFKYGVASFIFECIQISDGYIYNQSKLITNTFIDILVIYCSKYLLKLKIKPVYSAFQNSTTFL